MTVKPEKSEKNIARNARHMDRKPADASYHFHRSSSDRASRKLAFVGLCGRDYLKVFFVL